MNNHRLFADISDYQGTFDAHAYRSSGHVLIAIKAGEGVSHGGASNYVSRVRRAHRAGLTVMHYWFTRPENKNPREQAHSFSETVKGHIGRGDMLCLDVETGDSDNPYWFTLHCEREVFNLTNRRPIVYSYISYIRQHNLHASGKSLWIASYDGRVSPNSIPIIPGQHRWAKQFTDNHHFSGIGHTDASCLSLSAYRQIMRSRNHGRRVRNRR